MTTRSATPNEKGKNEEEEHKLVIAEKLRPALAMAGVAETDMLLQHQHPRPASVAMRGEDYGQLGPVGQHMVMSHSERVQMYVDVHGRHPEKEEELEQLALELEVEAFRIPKEDRDALMEALSRNPLLFISSPHIRLFLERENRDAKKASLRLARYWKQRQAMFGEKAYTDGVFSTPDFHDYMRLYNRSLKVASLLDPSDSMALVSREYLRCVNLAKISSMDLLLQNHTLYSSALLQAQTQNAASPEHSLSSDQHKLAFLLSEDLDEAKAAERMIRYWQKKHELFGPSYLHKEIYLQDMQDQEAHLRNSFIRVMPGTDDHGRVILSLTPEGFDFDSFKLTPTDFARIVWYVVHSSASLLADFVVLVNYSKVKESFAKANVMRQICIQYLFFILPLKVKAIHFRIHSKPMWQEAGPMVRKGIGPKLFSRLVVHLGNDEEFAIELEKYGIPKDQIPTVMGGNVGNDYWERWMMLRHVENP